MASEKILESKKAKVAALTEMLQDSVSFVLVDYKGISVEDDTKLRKELREAGVHYVVEKIPESPSNLICFAPVAASE